MSDALPAHPRATRLSESNDQPQGTNSGSRAIWPACSVNNRFRNFIAVLTKAREACANSAIPFPTIRVYQRNGYHRSGAHVKLEDWRFHAMLC